MLKTVFMGTPQFAADILRAFAEVSEVAAVVTQPDRPKGRGKKTAVSPVKAFALERGIPALQPEKVRGDDFPAALREFKPDMIVVAAYGRLLTEAVLNLPRFGCINVHASLLPKYRGASPVQAAIMAGETETGVSIMKMDKGIDTGEIILSKAISIAESDTGGSLTAKLSALGAEALAEAAALIESGRAVFTKQDGGLATYAPLITKETGHIDWSKGPDDVINLIRALDPCAPAFVYYNGEALRVWKAERHEAGESGAPGRVLELVKGRGLAVQAGGGSVLITELQPGSGKRMAAADYLRGRNIPVGTVFM